MTWEKWVNGILGLWVAVSAFLGLAAATMQINLIISGLIIAGVSFLSAASMPEERRAHP